MTHYINIFRKSDGERVSHFAENLQDAIKQLDGRDEYLFTYKGVVVNGRLPVSITIHLIEDGHLNDYEGKGWQSHTDGLIAEHGSGL